MYDSVGQEAEYFVLDLEKEIIHSVLDIEPSKSTPAHGF